MTSVEEACFGKLPDCAPVVEGEVVPLSKQRLVSAWISDVISALVTGDSTATCIVFAGGRRLAHSVLLSQVCSWLRLCREATPFCNVEDGTGRMHVQSV